MNADHAIQRKAWTRRSGRSRPSIFVSGVLDACSVTVYSEAAGYLKLGCLEVNPRGVPTCLGPKARKRAGHRVGASLCRHTLATAKSRPSPERWSAPIVEWLLRVWIAELRESVSNGQVAPIADIRPTAMETPSFDLWRRESERHVDRPILREDGRQSLASAHAPLVHWAAPGDFA